MFKKQLVAQTVKNLSVYRRSGFNPWVGKILWRLPEIMGFPSGSAGKESSYNAGDTGDSGSIPGSGRFLGEGNGNPLQYSCLENSMDRGAWPAAVPRVTKSRT